MLDIVYLIIIICTFQISVFGKVLGEVVFLAVQPINTRVTLLKMLLINVCMSFY